MIPALPWYNKKNHFGWNSMEIHQQSVTTQDGCPISYVSVIPKIVSKFPVLMVHGIGASGGIWLLGREESLPHTLCAQGFPVYIVNLRHRKGLIEKEWDLDDYVDFDLPTILRVIQNRHGKKKVHYIGHSMGGLISKMFQVRFGSEGLRSTVCIGSPGLQAKAMDAQLIASARPIIKVLSKALPHARLQNIPNPILQTIHTLSSMRGFPTEWPEVLGQTKIPEIQSLCANVARTEAQQLTSLVGEKGIKSEKHGFHYGEFMDRVIAPTLTIAGNRDPVAPPKLVKAGHDQAHTHDKKFVILGPAYGSQQSYNHQELLMGPSTHRDLWPIISNWLVERESK